MKDKQLPIPDLGQEMQQIIEFTGKKTYTTAIYTGMTDKNLLNFKVNAKESLSIPLNMWYPKLEYLLSQGSIIRINNKLL